MLDFLIMKQFHVISPPARIRPKFGENPFCVSKVLQVSDTIRFMALDEY
jgi:hypothetical protein